MVRVALSNDSQPALLLGKGNINSPSLWGLVRHKGLEACRQVGLRKFEKFKEHHMRGTIVRHIRYSGLEWVPKAMLW